MFGLVHFLESFELETQLTAFLKVMPQLAMNSPEWTKILHNRILNDEVACNTYLKILRSLNSEKPHFLYYLLEESAANSLNRKIAFCLVLIANCLLLPFASCLLPLAFCLVLIANCLLLPFASCLLPRTI